MHDVMIVDADLEDLALLLGQRQPDLRIVPVKPDEDVHAAVAEALADGPAVIHLMGHGAPGVIRIGARAMDSGSLDTQIWPQASSTTIQIYACGTGADDGQFVTSLAKATGARVAASSQPVGHAELGGDWRLDVLSEPFTVKAPPVAATTSWRHVLVYSGTATSGDDTLVGDDGGNTIDGLAGNDSITGGTGNDSLIGGLGDDTLVGGGNSGVAAGDTLNGGLGADHYVGGSGFTIVTYENATTGLTLDLTNGANNTGEAAGDSFVDIQRWIGSEYADSLTAGDTAVWFWGHGGNDVEHGGAGNDTLEAGDGNDSVFGGGGADLIYGRADNDELHGQDGDDTVAGGGGADLIHGEAGNDLLKGDWERDTIHGGDGDDTILAGIVTAGSYAQTQADTIYGEAGNDRYIVVSQYDAGTVSFDGGTGTDTLELRSDDLTSFNGYNLEYHTDVASPAIDISGMTLTSVETLALTGRQNHTVTMLGAQAAGFEVITASGASGTLHITGSADLSAVALSGIEAIEVTGSNAVLTLAASQVAGLRLTGDGNALAVAASGTGASADLSGVTGFARITLTGTAGADDLTVGAGATVTGNGGDDVIRIAAGTTGAVIIADAAVGDQLVMQGADLTTMRVETTPGSTTLRVGSGLAVTLAGSFEASQLQVGSGGSVTIVQATHAPSPPPVTSSSDPVMHPAVNHAPAVQADKTVRAQDRTAVSLGIAIPTDADGDALTVKVTGLPVGGSVRMANGSAVAVNQTLTAADLPGLTFLAAAGTAGNAGAFVYRVDDGRGGVAAQTIALQVMPSADPASTPQTPVAAGMPADFNALAYIASYLDLIAAFGTNTEAATQHYLQAGRAEGRRVAFDPLAYIASYPDLSAALGTDANAGARHFIEYGHAEGRSITFDGYNYLSANRDVALAYGLDPNAAASHYIQFGQAEGRPAQGFDALRYIASNPDLIQAFGPDVQAAEIHYVQFGYSEARSLTAFDPAAYLASHPEIATEFGTSPAAIELAYIKRSTSTAAEITAAANRGGPIAITMLAAGMTGAQGLGIDGDFHNASSSGPMPTLLAAGDGGLSPRQRTELPV